MVAGRDKDTGCAILMVWPLAISTFFSEKLFQQSQEFVENGAQCGLKSDQNKKTMLRSALMGLHQPTKTPVLLERIEASITIKQLTVIVSLNVRG